MLDGKDFEYGIKGLYEGIWRAIGWRDTRTLREAADMLRDKLYELADWIEGKEE
jgi:hypothetical protein